MEVVMSYGMRTLALVMIVLLSALFIVASYWVTHAEAGVGTDCDPRTPSVVDAPMAAVWVDILPCVCPNTLTGDGFLRDEARTIHESDASTDGSEYDWTRVKVVLLGNGSFPVDQIDLPTVTVGGVRCKSATIADCSTPPISGEPFPCCTQGSDGYNDLVLEVEKIWLWKAAMRSAVGNEAPIVVSGFLKNGSPFVGVDIVVVEHPGTMATQPSSVMDVAGQCSPNPFNPSTTFSVRFYQAAHYDVDVYDITGRRVNAWSGYASAGVERITWNGRDRLGSTAASGMYFLTVESGGEVVRGKMVLMK
jgi:hypothetical protein